MFPDLWRMLSAEESTVAPPRKRPRASRPRGGRIATLLRRLFVAVVAVVAAYFLVCTLLLVLFRFVDPPTTGVQLQRRVESWLAKTPYVKKSDLVPLERMSPHLLHAVVAAEDSRFFNHPGVDWGAIQAASEDNLRRRRSRGGSTITQQLVKNLFLTTHGSYARKALELPLAYIAELVLPKQRILELYLDVIEWGPGVYGAEAAARHHYGVGASALTREQAAALAACIPNPRRWKPERMDRYRDTILERMAQMGW